MWSDTVAEKDRVRAFVINRAGDVSCRVDKDAGTAAALREQYGRVRLLVSINIPVGFFLEYGDFSLKTGESGESGVGTEGGIGIIGDGGLNLAFTIFEKIKERRDYHYNNQYFLHAYIIHKAKTPPRRGF